MISREDLEVVQLAIVDVVMRDVRATSLLLVYVSEEERRRVSQPEGVRSTYFCHLWNGRLNASAKSKPRSLRHMH